MARQTNCRMDVFQPIGFSAEGPSRSIGFSSQAISGKIEPRKEK
jgi:hypothetical protein